MNTERLQELVTNLEAELSDWQTIDGETKRERKTASRARFHFSRARALLDKLRAAIDAEDLPGAVMLAYELGKAKQCGLFEAIDGWQGYDNRWKNGPRGEEILAHATDHQIDLRIQREERAEMDADYWDLRKAGKTRRAAAFEAAKRHGRSQQKTYRHYLKIDRS